VWYGRLFEQFAPETRKARLPAVDRLNSGTASWLDEAGVRPESCRDDEV